MTTDDVIALHKAVVAVIEAERYCDRTSVDTTLAVLRSSVITLATVQRDLLAAMVRP